MTPSHEVHETRVRPSVRFAEWLFGIAGGIALFLGLFIMFAGEDSSVGLGGEWSWTVGEITDAWMYGLLIGGAVLLMTALGMVMMRVGTTDEPRRQPSDLYDLLWHAGIFLAVNAFIWIQDIAIGGGLEYAYWITIPWGVGLAIHALVVMVNRHEPRGLQPH